jgi:hypothetical protein
MRLTQWQTSKSLVKAAMKLREDATFTLLLEMLEEESPLNLPLASQGPTADDRSYRLGMIEGYNKALVNMRATWTPPSPQQKPLIAKYASPEE